MNNLARATAANQAFYETGTVLRVEAGVAVVRTTAGDFRAQRAVSCLVAPEAQDKVLVYAAADGGCYVLAVLERAAGAGVRIACDGDLEVALPRGRFAVAAQHGVDLLSGRDVTVISQGLHVNAAEGHVAVSRLSAVGALVRAEFAKVKVLAGEVDQVFERLTQKAQRVYRVVTEFEQLRTERLDYEATQLMHLRSANALVTAESLVKVDGDQIHLG